MVFLICRYFLFFAEPSAIPMHIPMLMPTHIPIERLSVAVPIAVPIDIPKHIPIGRYCMGACGFFGLLIWILPFVL